MDIQKYTRVMQTIKGRKEHIDWIMDNAESMGKVSTFMIESICLQLRMMIEDIAVACVIANAEEMPELRARAEGRVQTNPHTEGARENQSSMLSDSDCRERRGAARPFQEYSQPS